jgi:hypothetical protein
VGRVISGAFAPGSTVDGEQEDLRVEAEATDRTAGEKSKRPGARPSAGAVRRGGLEVPAGGARVRDRCGRSRSARESGTRAAGVRGDLRA